MRKGLLLLLALVWAGVVSAQDKAQMTRYQQELQSLFEQVYTASTDNQRYHANEQALQLMAEALEADPSLRWQWDFAGRVSVLTASDKKFRILTWSVVNDLGEYECFGFVQALNERTKQYEVYRLVDRSADIINRQEEVLSADRWFGAVYQELILTTHEGRTFYTLLGWNGGDNLTQCKVIEPISFKSGGSQPQFGQNLFRKEPNLRRVVLEYKNNAMVTLRYEEQYVHHVEKIRAKRTGRQPRAAYAKPNRRGRKGGKGGRNSRRTSRPVATAARTSAAQQQRIRTAPTEKITDVKTRMIIFDEVKPQVSGMEGLYQYYVPSGVEMAYIFADGKWQLKDNAQGRVDNKKLNKDFDKPIEKKEPSYKVQP